MLMDKEEYRLPWKLVQNQIRACGGREIGRFRGIADPADTDNGAEAWIGSVTRANGANKDDPKLGCAKVVLPSGQIEYLIDVINENPRDCLGEAHMKLYGNELGMLVKLLDAKEPFLLQCHPTREVASKLWNSKYGKEECWHIIGTRKDTEIEPYILLGFKCGVDKSSFEYAFRHKDIKSLEDMCHKIPVHEGESYFIPGGMPHALGAGCFVVEIQEPSDLTAIPISQDELLKYRRKANPKGVFIPEDDELYEKRMLGSFDYSGRSLNEILDLCKSSLNILRKEDGGEERELFGKNKTKSFSCTLLKVNGKFHKTYTKDAQICLVLNGEGEIDSNGYKMRIKQGDELFFTYSSSNIDFNGDFSCILCNPGETAEYMF